LNFDIAVWLCPGPHQKLLDLRGTGIDADSGQIMMTVRTAGRRTIVDNYHVCGLLKLLSHGCAYGLAAH